MESYINERKGQIGTRLEQVGEQKDGNFVRRFRTKLRTVVDRSLKPHINGFRTVLSGVK